MEVVHYITQAGDTLSGIARKHNTTVAAISSLNLRIEDVNLIYPGELIHVPANVPAEEPTPPTPSNSLLVPEDGKIILGINRDGYDDNGAWGSNLAFEQHLDIVGRPPTVLHTYSTGSSFRKKLNAVSKDLLCFINCKPADGMGVNAYTRILSGEADSALADISDAINDYGEPIFLAIMHEPENDGSADSDTMYAEAYRYCVEKLRQTSEFVAVWNMMGWNGHGHRYDNLYPGDDVVDWIAWDPYVGSTEITEWRRFIDSPKNDFPGFYSWALPKGKPLMLAEWGIRASNTTAQNALLSASGIEQLKNEFPEVRALIYWSSNFGTDYRITNFPDRWRIFADLPDFQIEKTDLKI